MNNNDNIIGARIRELRIRLGITQKELAGDRITRNMLSLIESGSASPSVSTLVYISDRLGIPPGYFFTQTVDDEAKYGKSFIIDELKAKFAEKDFEECVRICDITPFTSFDDEIAYIAAISNINTALVNADEFNISLAHSRILSAMKFADITIYADDSVKRDIKYLSTLLSSVCSEEIPDELCDFRFCSERVPYETVMYFRACKNIGEINSDVFENTYFSRHIKAITLMQSSKHPESAKILRDLSLSPTLPYFMRFRVLSGLEEAANFLGDFKLAYSCARRKIELIGKSRIQ